MKDSRLGTYGVIGLILILSLKYFTLLEISDLYFPHKELVAIMIIAHSLSRLAAGSLIFTHEYVREDLESKAKPLSIRMSRRSFSVTLILGLLPVVLLNLTYWQILVAVIVMVGLARWLLARYFVRRIGGYTGDCLGAAQQICEATIYLGFVLGYGWGL